MKKYHCLVFTALLQSVCLLGFGQSSLPPLPTTDLSIPDRGGLSMTTDGAGADVVVNYARVPAVSGRAVPSGIAIFGLHNAGALISEVAVSGASAIQSGRVYAEIGNGVNTGLAIANPNSGAATISYSFMDSGGTSIGSGVVVIAPNTQMTKFLDQPPFNAPRTMSGTFSFVSSLPVSVAALRGFTNERGEFLLSSFPVIDLSTNGAAASLTLPHFAGGGGWTTQVILINRGNVPATGTLQWFDGAGKMLGTIPFSVAGMGSSNLQLPVSGSSAQTGSIQVVPDGGAPAPVPLAIFSYKPADVTLSQATVSSALGTAFRNYVFTSGQPGVVGALQSAVALANPAPAPADVTLDLTGLDGAHLASTQLSIPSNGQIAKFVSDIFASQAVSIPAQAILRISTSAPGIAVIGLRSRINERGSFLITTTPPTNEAAPVLSGDLFFPEVVNGGGYTSQFMLFSGSSALVLSADLDLMNADGTASQLPLLPVCDGVLRRPLLLRRIEPGYTDAALVNKITGTVDVSATVNLDGTLSVTGFIKTLGYGLDQNAQIALEQWRFCPATSNGQPVATNLTIQVSFNLQ